MTSTERARALAKKAADTDRPGMRIDSRDLDAGDQTQGLRNGRRSRAPDVLAAEDVNRFGDAKEFLGLFGGRSDLEIHQFLEAQFGEICRNTSAGECRRGEPCNDQKR
jgi:hypothetical protein